MVFNGEVRRGEIWMANVNLKNGERTSIQQGRRPVVIISCEAANIHSPVVDIVSLTTQRGKAKLPTHVVLGSECGLIKESIALCEQTPSIDKYDLMFKIGDCPVNKMKQIDFAIKVGKGFASPTIDVNKVNRMLNSIIELENIQIKYGICSDELILNKELLITDLDVYCSQYNVNYKELLNKRLSMKKQRLMRQVL